MMEVLTSLVGEKVRFSNPIAVVSIYIHVYHILLRNPYISRIYSLKVTPPPLFYINLSATVSQYFTN